MAMLLAFKLFRKNRVRTCILLVSVAVMSFLSALIFSLGVSVIASAERDGIRSQGTSAQYRLTDSTERQREALSSSGLAESVGVKTLAGEAQANGGRSYPLVYADREEWEQHRRTAFDRCYGSYPQGAGEIATSKSVLKSLGYGRADIGMSVELHTAGGAQEFVLSGYFEDSMDAGAAEKNNIYVSEPYLETAGKAAPLEATLYFNFKRSALERDMRLVGNFFDMPHSDASKIIKIKEIMGIGDGQSLSPVVPPYGNGPASGWLYLIFILPVLACGVVFVYNAMHLSMVREIRQFGLFRAIGMSTGQLTRVYAAHGAIIAALGGALGILACRLSAGYVIPQILRPLNVMEGSVQAWLSPTLCVVAAAMSLATVVVAIMVTLRKASKIGIADCAKYSVRGAARKRARAAATPCSADASGPRGMVTIGDIARKNISSGIGTTLPSIVILVIGIVLFNVVSAVTANMDAGKYADYALGGADILVQDTYYEASYLRDTAVTAQNVESIRNIPGVANLSLISEMDVQMKYSPALEAYMERFESKYGEVYEKAEYMESKLVGASASHFDGLAERDRRRIDFEDYGRGQVFLAGSDSDIPLDGTELEVRPQIGGMLVTLKIDHTIPVDQINVGEQPLPYVYMDPSALDALGEPIVREIRVALGGGADYASVLSEVRDIVPSVPEISVKDRLSEEKAFAGSRDTLRQAGFFAVFLLIAIGMISVANTMIFAIHSRRFELAAMHSLGMTMGQGMRLVALEGLCYGCVCGALVLAGGLASGSAAVKLLSEEAEYMDVSLPLAPLLTAVALVACLFVSVPIVVFRSYYEQPIAALLRAE
ncbi:MAG: FtsX-like permease family protein [Clostridiales Family XIII bacterium]|jgi:putative ABC transport system permease protein|nr:FtsX-like permease family protein [Clostridiales Family XIII bacterium]